MTERRLDPTSGTFRAERHLPGDKSLSHRALIFAAMAEGVSEVQHLGPGRDVASTRAAVQSLGIELSGQRYSSPGVGRWRPAPGVIDCGNSGTTLRLLAGALAGRPFPSTLAGDASLNRRPMGRLVDPLTALGAEVTLSAAGTAPLRVEASHGLHGAAVLIPLASAQVRSAFSLAALQAEGPSTIDGPGGFRDHTERWLVAFGLARRISTTHLEVVPGPVPAGRYRLPGDPSSAAFLWASAAIVPGAEVVTRDVSLNPGRIGFLQVLEDMGAFIEAEVTRDLGGDPVGDVKVAGRGLRGVVVDGEVAVAALDELPLVAVVAAYGEGTTIVKDAAELRSKESDRVATTVSLLRALGGAAEATDDGFGVVGTGRLEAGVVDAAGDHRIAMAAAVAATAATGTVTVRGAEAADVSWPGFYDELEALWSSR